jgi:hypothetical protein
VRQSMQDVNGGAGHPAYEKATAAYQSAVPLFRKGYVAQLHKVATENPESLANMSGKNPTKLQMLWDVLGTHATQGGDAKAGEAAKDAVRSAWTFKNLIDPGLEKFPDSVKKMDPEFAQKMYGDPAGKLVITNLGEISDAYQGAVKKEGQLASSSLMKKGTSARTAAIDAALVATHPGSALTAIRLADLMSRQGPKMKDLVQWASYSPQGTQMLVKALQGATPGVAVANLLRTFGTVAGHEETAMPVSAATAGEAGAPPSMVPAASHAPTTPPPSR